MSSPANSFASVLGANTTGAIATATTGQHRWLVLTSIVTAIISAIALLFSLVAKKIR